MGTGAVTAERCLLYAVSVDQHCGLGVTLARALCDGSGDSLVR
jgi:hypothetical protein